jgi:hypothetical protein
MRFSDTLEQLVRRLALAAVHDIAQGHDADEAFAAYNLTLEPKRIMMIRDGNFYA